MFRRLTARASVLASVVLVALASACSDATLPSDIGGAPLEGSEDTAFRRSGTGKSLPGNGNTVVSLEITPDAFSTTIGETASLVAVLRTQNGHVAEGTVTWKSSDPTVTTVDAGAVRALKTGTALITAEYQGLSDTARATVTQSAIPVDSVIVSPDTASVVVGQNLTLEAQPVDSTGTGLTNRAVTWSSSNSGVASVTSDGKVTGVAAGQAMLRASAEDEATSVPVTVEEAPAVPVATVTVTPSPATVKVGATVQLSATVKDADGTVLTGRALTWSTSNQNVAKVSSTGLVSGVGAGTVSITATSEGQSGTSTVEVTPSTVAVASVSMSQATAAIEVGATVQLVATPKDADGQTLTGRTIAWATSNSSVATVSSSGLVKGMAAGSASVTATVEGKVGTTAVTVTTPPIAPTDPLPAPAPTDRVGYYVAPNGASGNAGTRSSPWDLASVLRGSKPVAPGDTVWVLGGTYRGAFINYMNGTSSKQIVVRGYPGQRATVDGDILVLGSYVTLWGLEVMNSNPLSSYKIGVNVKSPGSRVVNMVVHDAGASGVGLWNEAPNAVLHGSIIYNNGSNDNQDHGVYFNGNTGTKYVSDNIVFNNFAYGLHAYSATSGELNNLRIEGNASFNNGSTGPRGTSIDLHVGGSFVTNVFVGSNMTWRRDDGEITLRLLDGSNVSMAGNRTVGNTVISSSWSRSNDVLWSSSSPPTSGTHVIVRPNAYEAGRANIIVYNWSQLGSVSADLSSVLRIGDTYEVRNAQNFYAAPVLSGTYGGGSISLPMAAIQPLPLIGRTGSTPQSTGTVFHAFVVVKTN